MRYKEFGRKETLSAQKTIWYVPVAGILLGEKAELTLSQIRKFTFDDQDPENEMGRFSMVHSLIQKAGSRNKLDLPQNTSYQ